MTSDSKAAGQEREQVDTDAHGQLETREIAGDSTQISDTIHYDPKKIPSPQAAFYSAEMLCRGAYADGNCGIGWICVSE